jgi:leader peptidase (prepilin peptidase) / N-methyltransferase
MMLFLGGVIVFLLGLVVGGLVNLAIYTLAWNARWISPWSPSVAGVAARGWLDRIPVFGWCRLRREVPNHGPGFWIRPMLIELGLASLLTWLYVFYLRGGLLPLAWRQPGMEIQFLPLFAAHAMLISLMTICTFIDVDEKTIPDAITIPGVWLGMLIAAAMPSALLPDFTESVWLTTPGEWPEGLDDLSGLLLGLACVTGWCYALLPKTWWTRSGWLRAFQFLVASIVRHPFSRLLALMWLAAMVFVVAGWLWGGEHWKGLLSSLVGLACGGGIVWAVRVIGSLALDREAMGFGDVTLMAMIGSFVGWQASLIIFLFRPSRGWWWRWSSGC